jgi:hypothetical protein
MFFDLEDVLEARADAETLMVDSCTITRPGVPVTDPETGAVTNEPVTVYPTPEQIAAGNPGKCEVQLRNTVAASPEAGEHAFTVVSLVVKIPADSADVLDGDVVTLTASRLPVKEIL